MIYELRMLDISIRISFIKNRQQELQRRNTDETTFCIRFL